MRVQPLASLEFEVREHKHGINNFTGIPGYMQLSEAGINLFLCMTCKHSFRFVLK
jgi:hypothetical protein